ncbi:MAG: peptidoglycan-binding protein [Candidatus Ancillula sp.]|nr:peptidoglycan-binding protein [Candidatus Ancillula sp.]
MISRVMNFLKTVLTRRFRWLVLLIIFSCAFGTLGLVVGMHMKSPEQVKAEAQPPSPSQIKSKVEQKVLENSVISRGEIGSDSQLLLGIGGLRKDGAIDKPGTGGMLTASFVKPGDELKEGVKVLEVDGRPLILLQGEKPTYRDFATGEEGDDIKQLQNSLTRLGYYCAVSGKFDTATADALERFYRALGYPLSKSNAGSSSSSASKAQDTPNPADTGVDAGKPATPAERTVSISHNEIIFLPSFPLWTTEVATSVGYGAPEVVLKMSSSQLIVSSKLNPSDCSLAQKGVDAQLFIDESQPTSGKIVSACDANSVIHIAPDAPLDFSLVKKNIKVQLVAAKTSNPVLTVPLSAIFSNSEGKLFVIKSDSDKQIRVEVKTGAKNPEEIEITPVNPEQLKAGDEIIVGQNAS